MVFLLCAVFLRTAYAEEIEDTMPYRTTGICSDVTDAEYEFYYSDSFFSGTSYEMNADLARLAMRMAFSGFGVGKESDASDLLRLFDRLSIRYDDSTVHYGVPGPDTIGYAYGMRTIADDEVLIVAVVRGGNYKEEWAGNFTLGLSDDHEGFRSAADLLVKDLQKYIETVPAGKNVSVLVTGYSRGAAVSNLAAADLDKLASEGKLGAAAPDDIYGYCFACPLTTKRTQEAGEALYGNIFSFVHPADPVPKVAPGAWGYGRFGTTLLLPTSIHTDDYNAYYENVSKGFRRYAAVDGKEYPLEAVDIITADRRIATLTDTVLSPIIYVKTMQNAVRSAIIGGENAANNPGNSMISSFLSGFGDGGTVGRTAGNFAAAHAPEMYLAALDAIGDGTILRDCRSEYGYWIVDPGVPVRVSDAQGNAVFDGDGVKCSFAAERHTVGATYGSKGELWFDFPRTETYYAVITADKDMTVSFRCGVFDTIASKEATRNEYTGVALKKGETAVVVLNPDEPVLYIGQTGSAEELLAAVLSGEVSDARTVKANRIYQDGQKTWDSADTKEPTPTEAVTRDSSKNETKSSVPRLWILSAVGCMIVVGVIVAVTVRRKRRNA